MCVGVFGNFKIKFLLNKCVWKTHNPNRKLKKLKKKINAHFDLDTFKQNAKKIKILKSCTALPWNLFNRY